MASSNLVPKTFEWKKAEEVIFFFFFFFFGIVLFFDMEMQADLNPLKF